jgi:hypothetical protein
MFEKCKKFTKIHDLPSFIANLKALLIACWSVFSTKSASFISRYHTKSGTKTGHYLENQTFIKFILNMNDSHLLKLFFARFFQGFFWKTQWFVLAVFTLREKTGADIAYFGFKFPAGSSLPVLFSSMDSAMLSYTRV